MEIDNYPGNKDIILQRQAILELEKSKDPQALQLAKLDLYAMVKQKRQWLQEKTSG